MKAPTSESRLEEVIPGPLWMRGMFMLIALALVVVVASTVVTGTPTGRNPGFIVVLLLVAAVLFLVGRWSGRLTVTLDGDTLVPSFGPFKAHYTVFRIRNAPCSYIPASCLRRLGTAVGSRPTRMVASGRRRRDRVHVRPRRQLANSSVHHLPRPGAVPRADGGSGRAIEHAGLGVGIRRSLRRQLCVAPSQASERDRDYSDLPPVATEIDPADEATRPR